jgi:hypothetical protein
MQIRRDRGTEANGVSGGADQDRPCMGGEVTICGGNRKGAR